MASESYKGLYYLIILILLSIFLVNLLKQSKSLPKNNSRELIPMNTRTGPTEDENGDLLQRLHDPADRNLVYTNAPPKKGFFPKKVEWKDMPDRYIVSKIPDTQLPNNAIQTTKYNVITFIPKNLMEQFSKLANVYFLLIGILQTIPAISTTNGEPVIYGPLAIILIISAIKDLIEDLKRRSDDRRENFSKTMKFTNNGFETCDWKDLQVGDIIKVQNNEYIPADMILLKSSESNGTCFIETKNLDGETNLKPRSVDKAVLAYFNEEDDFKRRSVEVNFERPNPYLYTFRGNMKLENGKELPLTNNSFLLRACSLKSPYAIGMVAYTGHDTKIMLNSVSARGKSSKLERMMNKQIIMVFIIQNIWCLLISLYATIWFQNEKNELPYLDYQSGDIELNPWAYFFIKYGNWIVIFTNFVPISLLVTLEMVKFIQAHFITKDDKMVDDVNHVNAAVQTSRLMEELGQVNYIFSDKTGTLTCNIMEFKKVCVKGTTYGENREYEEISRLPKVTNVDFKDEEFFRAIRDRTDENHESVHELLLLLATCHTINIEMKGKERNYSASSPDELALVNFAKLCGYEYIGTNENEEILLEVNGKSQKYKLIHVLEFDSDRKRMSVIIETPNGEIVLYCKGADSIILDRMDRQNTPDIERIMKQVENYANEGLRTLLVAKRVIPRDIFQTWSANYVRASSVIQEREANMAKLQDEIEKKLVVIGATAIEDKLQDQVGETIKAFKDAGIKVWVLTGDKTETAINIGHSCKLLDKSQEVYIIDVETHDELSARIKEVEEQVERRIASGEGPFALVVTGKSLIHSTNAERGTPLSERLYLIFAKAEAVVACRVSPKQKRDIVELVKGKIPTAVTLAIGDGANDVNMITAAHVGVGIKGLEGYQAARASDFAIGEFKLTRRLLLFYGREAYRKNSVLVLYNFFKNQILILPQFWYGFWNGMSGTSLYEPVIFQLYNIFYASLPIVIFAVFDKEFSGSFLSNHPKYYKPGLQDSSFNYKLFWRWFASGSIQAIFIALTAFGALSGEAVDMEGRTVGFFSAGMMAFTSLIVCANLKILLFSNNFNVLVLFVVFGSILFYVANFAGFAAASWSADYEEFGLIFGQWDFYFGVIIMVVLTTGIDLAISRNKYSEIMSQDQDIAVQLRKQSSKPSRRHTYTFRKITTSSPQEISL